LNQYQAAGTELIITQKPQASPSHRKTGRMRKTPNVLNSRSKNLKIGLWVNLIPARCAPCCR